ncbi:similar to Saccharomyces cerevisiae YAL044C GCV3 H subunit of the mitochondrial glycine decarboxylase complex, required for the catabolism of glycine to 5,10-methylene-THF [Maudiozyma barnettii]|uniref:Glycine cleavage system H protein n=1 Tax=Maudiozyma barnettii TaxID=61262 RepID=A0A8H2VH47_9SACH|nr:glycine decarboxylase subunit H [Kazachstania barnettii]CAB4255336.1 similar to Saccharomyces cerevisiae YAL044C GCV3 H subunit of the mitochondrial glycine decarboxylase complex, required for the catabolism of glycine to 5,10-methylene-THF [Kazachstania barnettii]CAD1783742.1 similar to Saccharomyces cerevisiae YAL044C GCV3 H subunit of the mitochondrial glycine decarboxylase complex, required for the catabolism of glycine to 5,10-methylene-THF [Kazachstania barnettii]
MLSTSTIAKSLTRTVPRVFSNTSKAPSLRLFLRCQSTSHGNNNLNKNELPFKFSPAGPKLVKYSKDHEWLAMHADGTTFLGITDYAAAALGDATYIELPEADTEVDASDSIGSVESVKSASEVYVPVSGTVVEGNTDLESSPQLINSDPMGKGWIAKLKVDEATNKEILDKLFTLEQYEQFLKSDE